MAVCPVSAPTHVVGDLHGHLEVLKRLLRDAGLLSDGGRCDNGWCGVGARLLFLGDFFNRGPDGLGCLELFMQLQREATAAGGWVEALVGNHDLLLLAAHRFGEGASTGPDVTGVGDRACALLSGGGYAEYAAVPAELLMPVPPGWTAEQAASLPEVFLTAHLNLFGVAGSQAGKAGWRVFATAGTDSKVRACTELGATVFNYRMVDFVEAVREHAEGVDVVLDMVGQSYLERNVELLNTGGRLVVIATLSRSSAQLDLLTLMSKRLSVHGLNLRSHPLAEVQLEGSFQERF